MPKASADPVSSLLARAGHDVRGPAGVVAGALDELALALGDEAAASNAVFFTMARRGVRRLLRLADRYTVMSELARRPDTPMQAMDLEPLVRAAVDEASFVYGRRHVALEPRLTAVRGVAHPAWMAAALTDAVMLALRDARARVIVELAPHGDQARVTVTSDADAAPLEEAYRAALAPAAEAYDEGALAARVLDGVLKLHGGAARVERAGAGVRIVLEWPLREPERAGGAP